MADSASSRRDSRGRACVSLGAPDQSKRDHQPDKYEGHRDPSKPGRAGEEADLEAGPAGRQRVDPAGGVRAVPERLPIAALDPPTPAWMPILGDAQPRGSRRDLEGPAVGAAVGGFERGRGRKGGGDVPERSGEDPAAGAQRRGHRGIPAQGVIPHPLDDRPGFGARLPHFRSPDGEAHPREIQPLFRRQGGGGLKRRAILDAFVGIDRGDEARGQDVGRREGRREARAFRPLQDPVRPGQRAHLFDRRMRDRELGGIRKSGPAVEERGEFEGGRAEDQEMAGAEGPDLAAGGQEQTAGPRQQQAVHPGGARMEEREASGPLPRPGLDPRLIRAELGLGALGECLGDHPLFQRAADAGGHAGPGQQQQSEGRDGGDHEAGPARGGGAGGQQGQHLRRDPAGAQDEQELDPVVEGADQGRQRDQQSHGDQPLRGPGHGRVEKPDEAQQHRDGADIVELHETRLQKPPAIDALRVSHQPRP